MTRRLDRALDNPTVRQVQVVAQNGFGGRHNSTAGVPTYRETVSVIGADPAAISHRVATICLDPYADVASLPRYIERQLPPGEKKSQVKEVKKPTTTRRPLPGTPAALAAMNPAVKKMR